MRQRWLMGTMLVPVAVALMMMGCGGGAADRDPVAKVTCTVTVNGQPLTTGLVTFKPTAGTKGRGSSGRIKNGKVASLKCYGEGDGAIVGTHEVRINAVKAAAAAEGADPAGVPPTDITELIPAKYNLKTTLTATVEAGKDNTFTFDLEIPDFKMP